MFQQSPTASLWGQALNEQSLAKEPRPVTGRNVIAAVAVNAGNEAIETWAHPVSLPLYGLGGHSQPESPDTK